ncbi:MAG: acetyl/propionyl/methylcrotonyl-CoA carboxylase subunit alpha [Hyphomicrobium sp.]
MAKGEPRSKRSAPTRAAADAAVPALSKVLIANRGEIACRIARTARRMGLSTVAVYSDADREAAHVRAADEAVHIGPSPAVDSYLDIGKVVAAARASGADCVHPGYGFLSENADFAEAVQGAGLTFIGPSPAAMRALGNKAAARELAARLGIPIVPGAHGAAQDTASLAAEAARIGFPVMIKAAAGGGGRGMRAVQRPADFSSELASAVREARAAFGDGRMLIEKLIREPRHVEVQVFADRHGRAVHLYERDCTLQRRHQKIIEEAPAPGMSRGLRERLTGAALQLVTEAGYENAATVEFLAEGGRLDAAAPYYFIEVNTRLQVEHPVTEAITGLDLVEWQFRIAAGEPLPRRQDEIEITGHAVEARLCAEDPADGFAPSTGRLVAATFPERPDVRVETAVATGDVIGPHYDSMIAKLVASGADRPSALNTLDKALSATRVLGVATNAHLLRRLVRHEAVIAARFDTGFIGRALPALIACVRPFEAIQQAVRGLLLDTSQRPAAHASPWDARDGFSLGSPRVESRDVVIDGWAQSIVIAWGPDGPHIEFIGSTAGSAPAAEGVEVVIDAGVAYALLDLQQVRVAWPQPADGSGAGVPSGDLVRAPITGRVAKVFMSAGVRVELGTPLAIVEAMKMEHVIASPRAAVVLRPAVVEGQQIEKGALVAELGPATA